MAGTSHVRRVFDAEDRVGRLAQRLAETRRWKLPVPADSPPNIYLAEHVVIAFQVSSVAAMCASNNWGWSRRDPRHPSVIAFLGRQDGMIQTELASVLDTGKASLGSLIDGLEDGKWVERCPDPIDRRAERIYLTRKSGRSLREMRSVERSLNDQILLAPSGKERKELVEFLLRIKGALAEIAPSISNEDELQQLA
jgi:DNA-binding MarR family transcriptional regulator